MAAKGLGNQYQMPIGKQCRNRRQKQLVFHVVVRVVVTQLGQFLSDLIKCNNIHIPPATLYTWYTNPAKVYTNFLYYLLTLKGIYIGLVFAYHFIAWRLWHDWTQNSPKVPVAEELHLPYRQDSMWRMVWGCQCQFHHKTNQPHDQSVPCWPLGHMVDSQTDRLSNRPTNIISAVMWFYLNFIVTVIFIYVIEWRFMADIRWPFLRLVRG